MSEESKRKPKPFLKKGARQFLSNATVRSLNQKPKVVDFNEETQNQPQSIRQAIRGNEATFGRDQQEIKITVRRNTFKDPEVVVNEPKTKENKHSNQQRTHNSNNSKRKPGLEDYIGTSNSKKNGSRNSFQKQSTGSSIGKSTHTMTTLLTKQQEDVDSDEESMMHNQLISTKQHSTPLQQHPLINKTLLNQVQTKSTVHQEQSQEVCFNSDSDEEPRYIQKKKTEAKRITGAPKVSNAVSSNRWEEEDEEGGSREEQEEDKQSKIFQKFYQKDGLKKTVVKVQPPKAAKLSLEDIPRELKEQIVSKYILEKKSEIENKMLELQQLQIKRKTQKERYQELNKVLSKEKEELQRETDKKEKEHQEKMKTENDKIQREKKYLKNHQEGAKGDWKLKNQIQELQHQVVKVEKEKKEIKVKLQKQVERLQGKLQEVSVQNQHLKESIRCIEREKIEVKKMSKENGKRIEPVKKLNNFWEGAPTKSYIYDFAQPSFSLLNVQMSYFTYQHLEHYQYYLSKKEEGELESQEENASQGKITRRYKNGKMEIQRIGTVLKQLFPSPFKFTVVNFLNGDLKLIYPQSKIQIYYDQRNKITQFKIAPQKTIYSFHQRSQIEMKYRHPQQGEIKQVRTGNSLMRYSRHGQQKFQIGGNGAIKQLY